MICIQSYLIHGLPKPLNEIDLATAAMICIFLEHGIWFSVFLAILSGGFLDSLSVVKPGFFILYFLISILMIQLLSKFFVYHGLSNKFIIFLGLFLFKFLLIYFLIDDGVVSILNFILNNYLQFIMTSVVFFVMIKIIPAFEFLFNRRHFDRSYL